MKKKLLVLVAIILFCSLGGCASIQNASVPKVMLILRSWSSAAAEDVTQGANAAAREYGLALTTKAVLGGDEPGQQAELIRTAIDKKFSAIIIEPADSGTVGQAVREARGRGIAVISIGSREQIGQNCTVDIDERQLTEGMVSQIRSLTGGEVRLLILNCLDDYDNTQRMTDVLTRGMAGIPDIQLDGIDFYTGEYSRIESSLKYSVPEDKEGFAVIALNEYAANAAVNLIRSIPDGQKIALVSFAKDAESVSLLEQGWVDAICVNRNIDIGYRAVRQANEAIGGGEPADVWIPSAFVTGENLFHPDMQELLFPVS